jgi:hypothetical protein
MFEIWRKPKIEELASVRMTVDNVFREAKTLYWKEDYEGAI